MNRRSILIVLGYELFAFLAQALNKVLGRHRNPVEIPAPRQSLSIRAIAPADSVNIRDFGAVGDGTTNDASAINDAILFLSRQQNGGTIWFPKGRYWLDPGSLEGAPKQLYSHFSNIIFAGESSKDSEWLISPSFSRQDQRLFYHDKPGDYMHWTFRDLHINSQGLQLPESQECRRDKLFKVFVSNFKVQRCTFSDEPGRGLFTVLGDHQHFQDCYFYRVGCRATDSSVLHPGNILHQVNHVLIVNCLSFSDNVKKNRFNRTTFYDAQASHVLIRGCQVKGGKKGIILALGALANNNIYIENCDIEVHHHCLHVYPSRNVNVHSGLSNLNLRQCRLASAVPINLDALRTAQVTDGVIDQCRIHGSSPLARYWLKLRFVRHLLLKEISICQDKYRCRHIDQLLLSAKTKRVVRGYR